MSINILDMVKSQIGGQIAGQIAGKFGVNEQTAKAGIDALLPTILGGLVSKVSSPGGTETLDRTLDEGDYDGGMLDNLGDIFSGNSGDELANKGGGVVSMIFGDKAAVLGPIIAKLTGMKSDSVMSMLAMLAPLVMSYLGKAKSSAGMDANGLASMLMSQKDSIASAMPPGVSDAMGLGLLPQSKPAATPAPAPAPQAAEGGGGGLAKILIPLVILGAVGYGCYKYIFAGIRPPGEQGNLIIEQDPNGANDGGYGPEEGSAPAAATPAEATPATTAATPEFDVTKMPAMFKSLGSTFEEITDVESAKAAMPKLETMDKQLDAASSSLAAVPELVRGPIIKTLQDNMPAVESAIEKALAIPGVGDVLKPIVDSMMSKIKPLLGDAS
ncbi:DUF937 domain-containing protein [Rubripirellula reticaptiva]|uniref:DUF937 domain-containing protein n=1 Tax=Rubripirellula reticaptiva TaxID=2528013 RepID=A0A5C6EI29_9BACT|nr:DUF937 domain-containing protein [Rubripirellula reticaptiva]TWU47717.1 hypothetical protein Poly59_45580 [Rubripirellula reticaptiva]